MKTLPAHSDPVTAVTFNYDGTLIASCAMDGLVYVFLVCCGSWVDVDVLSIAVCGTQIRVSVSRPWQMTTIQFGMLQPQTPVILALTPSWDSSHIEFTPNSRYILVGTQDSTIRLWDTQTSRCVKTYTGHTNRTYSLFAGLAPGGKYIVSGSEDCKVYLWNLQTRKIEQVLEGHRGNVLRCCMDADCSNLLTI